MNKWQIEEPDGLGTYWVWRKDFIDMFMVNVFPEFLKYDFKNEGEFGSCQEIFNLHMIPLENPHRKFMNDECVSHGDDEAYTIYQPMYKYIIKNNEPVVSEEWKWFFENTYVMEVTCPDEPKRVAL